MRHPFTLTNLFLVIVALAFIAFATGCTTPCQDDPSQRCAVVGSDIGLGWVIGGFF